MVLALEAALILGRYRFQVGFPASLRWRCAWRTSARRSTAAKASSRIIPQRSFAATWSCARSARARARFRGGRGATIPPLRGPTRRKAARTKKSGRSGRNDSPVGRPFLGNSTRKQTCHHASLVLGQGACFRAPDDTSMMPSGASCRAHRLSHWEHSWYLWRTTVHADPPPLL